MLESTEAQFERTWSYYKECQEFLCNKLVCKYFENNLLPKFKKHSAIWVLKAAGISCPDNGLTNNASESLNAVLHSLKQWKEVPLDVSLFHLSSFYHKEIERGFHQCGTWVVKEEFSFLQRQLSLMPNMSKTIDPKEIVSRSRGEILKSNVNSGELEIKQPSTSQESQLGLARDALQKKWVTLADTGCWIVRGSDGVTPYVVTLFPKETCSCSAIKCYYHIIACKLMIGLSIDDVINPNMSLLH